MFTNIILLASVHWIVAHVQCTVYYCVFLPRNKNERYEKRKLCLENGKENIDFAKISLDIYYTILYYVY